MAYVYSTLTNDQIYTLWRPSKEEGKPNVAIKKVQIKGGHGRMGKNLVTPLGVVTEVTDEELDALQKCTAFVDHVKAGFIKVEKKKDASAQKTPLDFANPPKVGKPEDDND